MLTFQWHASKDCHLSSGLCWNFPIGFSVAFPNGCSLLSCNIFILIIIIIIILGIPTAPILFCAERIWRVIFCPEPGGWSAARTPARRRVAGRRRPARSLVVVVVVVVAAAVAVVVVVVAAAAAVVVVVVVVVVGDSNDTVENILFRIPQFEEKNNPIEHAWGVTNLLGHLSKNLETTRRRAKIVSLKSMRAGGGVLDSGHGVGRDVHGRGAEAQHLWGRTNIIYIYIYIYI